MYVTNVGGARGFQYRRLPRLQAGDGGGTLLRTARSDLWTLVCRPEETTWYSAVPIPHRTVGAEQRHQVEMEHAVGQCRDVEAPESAR